MAQSLNITLNLGTSKTGLTIYSQLYNDAGATVGGLVTTGFTELERGMYRFHYAAYPDDFSGWVSFFDTADDSFLTDIGLNASDFGAGSGGGASVDDILSAQVPGAFPSGSVGERIGRIAGATIQVTGALNDGGDIELRVEDSYLAVNGTAIDFPDTHGAWPDLTDEVVHFYVQSLDIAATVINPAGPSKTVRVEMTSAQTATLLPVKREYAIKVLRDGEDELIEKETILEGWAMVKQAP